MEPEEYRRRLAHFGLTQEFAGVLFGVSKRTGQNWAKFGPPRAVAMVLLMARNRKVLGEFATISMETEAMITSAQGKLGRAIKAGKIIKPIVCQKCGNNGNIHGHHNNYLKPLDVEWLCVTCHGKLRNQTRNYFT
jgi:hypothetical protein